MKATSKIGLVKTNLIGIRVTSPLFITLDPNFYKVKELETIPASLHIFYNEGTRDVPGFIRGGNKSGPRDHTIIRQG